MKRCPQCGREYDNTMSFCRDDGSELLYGPPSTSSGEEAATSIFPGPTVGESATAVLPARLPTSNEPENSIAVLPFANMSADAENEYFCDGLAEELLNALSKIEDLKVAARTSAFSFKGKQKNISEIANALNVKTVLEGSVRKSANRVRITANLINAADGYRLWSEQYDREMRDIFDIQDEITVTVVDALKVKLLGKEKIAVLKRHTNSPEAYELYLRGLAYYVKWTREFFHKAIECFEQAIAIDPRYAAAYAVMAECYTELSFFSSTGDWIPKAKEAASKALEHDDTLGEGHNALAVILMYFDHDFTAAEREFKRAISLDPANARFHNWYGWYLGLMGRFEEGLKEMKRALELDPLSELINFGVGAIYHWARQPEHAIESFQRILASNSSFLLAFWFLIDAYIAKGEVDSAIVTIENSTLKITDPVTLSTIGYAYAKAGNPEKAYEILGDLERQLDEDNEASFYIAQIYLGLGDKEQTLTWLERAVDERSVWLIPLGRDPKFDPLRSEPRFKRLLRRMNLPE